MNIWSLYSFVSRSKQRRKIFLLLESPKTPTEIGDEAKVSVSHVSRTLREFTEKRIVKCLTPDEKIGRIYGLTKEGKLLLKKMRKKL